MARLFLFLALGFGVLLVLGRMADRLPVSAGPAAPQGLAAEPVPNARPRVIGAARADTSVVLAAAAVRTPLIAQLARIEARRRLTLAGKAVYLDSLLTSPDSTIRRWGEGAVLRVFIRKTPEALPVLVAVTQAMRVWHDLRLGPTLVETQDSLEANVIVGWVAVAESDRTGLAQIQASLGGEILTVAISLARADDRRRVIGLDETRSIALHEFGHALGLPHSGRTTDIMYPTVTVSELSARDRSTAELLYAIPPGPLREPVP